MEDEVLMYIYRHSHCKLVPEMEKHFEGRIPRYDIISVLAKAGAKGLVYRSPKMTYVITKVGVEYFNFPPGFENKPWTYYMSRHS